MKIEELPKLAALAGRLRRLEEVRSELNGAKLMTLSDAMREADSATLDVVRGVLRTGIDTEIAKVRQSLIGAGVDL